MKAITPICSNPQAFQLLWRQVRRLKDPAALVQGATAIAMHGQPASDPATVDAILSGYARTIRERVRGTQQQAILAHMHDYLFEELGFQGNRDDYYLPANSYLPQVLETKRGLPILLSLIYKVVGHKLGLKVHGIGLPGHFVIAVETGDSAMLVDPYNKGRLITADEAHDLVKESVGPEAEFTEEMLHPFNNLHWLTRILQNLLHTFSATNQFTDVAAMLELEMALWPRQTQLQRDLALVLARIGKPKAASAWLNKYLKSCPDDPQSDDLRQLLEVLSN